MSTPTSNNNNNSTRPLPNNIGQTQQRETPGGTQPLTSPRIPVIQRQSIRELNPDIDRLFIRLRALRNEESEILLELERLSVRRRSNSPLGTNVTTTALVDSPSATTSSNITHGTPPTTPPRENIFKPVRF